MPLYEVAKRAAAPGGGAHLPAADAAALGALVGVVAATLTTPADVLKTRAMTGAGEPAGLAATARAVVRTRGYAGLFAGAPHRALYVGPSCAIFFVVYEAAARFLETRHAAGEGEL